MARVLAFLLFGFLPTWIAVTLVVMGSHASYVPADYWNTAPWLIMFSIPLSLVSLPITLFVMSKMGKKEASFRHGRKW